MTMKLAGKKALVTGSNQGIGQGIVYKLAEEGADIVVNYVAHPETAQETVQKIEKMGRKAFAIEKDVSKVPNVQALMKEAIEKLGGMDILVNNAGVEKNASFQDIIEEDYDKVVNLNLKGAFFLTQAFVQYLLKEKKKGKIINISSVHEDLPFPHFTPYCVSKGGMKMMMRNLAIELGPYGITVNNIAPGAIITPINTALEHDEEELALLKGNIPLGYLGKPEDVAGAAAYLASADADYVTGTTLVVDGGLTWDYSEQ